MAKKYVKIEDRVSTAYVGDCYHTVEAVTDLEHCVWRTVAVDGSNDLAQIHAGAIRDAIRDACEAVRERCLEAAVATIRNAAGDTLEQTADEVDAAIGELEL